MRLLGIDLTVTIQHFYFSDIFKSLEKGLHKAQEDIIEAKAGLTTLCATVISQLLYPTNGK